jgi:site-specific DNA-methyltransferase (adenine-specific)
VWKKDQVSNPQLAKVMPLKNHENICVFSANGHDYKPQGLIRSAITRRADSAGKNLGHLAVSKGYTQEFTNYPKTLVRFNSERGIHPTQKPVALYEYLIRTYTNEGELVLDMCAGSGTTGVAALNTGRRVICIEKRKDYATIARARIAKAAEQARQGELFAGQ